MAFDLTETGGMKRKYCPNAAVAGCGCLIQLPAAFNSFHQSNSTIGFNFLNQIE